MLVTRRRGRLRLIRHPDHGRLAGQLGENWGNERFAIPVPRNALLQAATHHDDGWTELDDRPAYNPDAQRPAHFLELALPDTVGPYGRGVNEVYGRDRYAGALVSMHWAGLYSTRWGLQEGSPVPHPAAAEVVAEQERRWVPALREAWGQDGLRSEFEANTWHAYEVLQTLDFLALALCLLDLERPTAASEALAMPVTLAHVDQPPGARIVPAVPVASGGEHLDVTVRVPAPGRVSVEPYPFRAPEIELEVPARELDDRRYADGEAQSAYHDAPIEPLRIVVQRDV
jgi:uncharacterized protein DUF3891